MRALFILVTFLGSFTLFLLEPMVAKVLLPRFGGSSLVWNGSLLFFQALLLGGYAYAHYGALKLGVQKGARVHLIAAVVALALTLILFVGPKLWSQAGKPSAFPLADLVITLLFTTGAPFFILSAGTPLIQRWYLASGIGKSPYFLYAASNLGSLFALLAYPTIIESQLGLVAQRELAAGLVLVYVLLLFGCSRLARTSVETTDSEAETPVQISNKRKWRWAALSAAPSALLLATTTDITKNIAPIPLLWVLPLAIYLATFIVAFSGKSGKPNKARSRVTVALPILLFPLVFVSAIVNPPLQISLAVSCLTFYVCAQICHLELAWERPEASQLTDFYLWLSIGGVLGGLFSAFLSPLLFTNLTELPLSLFACVLFFGITQPNFRWKWYDAFYPAIALAAIYFLKNHFSHGKESSDWIVVAGLAFIGAAFRPALFALAFGAVLLVTATDQTLVGEKLLQSERNFYGFEKVYETQDGAWHRLLNGTILHGIQATDPVKRHTPYSYYLLDGPLGQALTPAFNARPHIKVAAVGLGSGTIAAYGRPGTSIDFYELNPAIEQVAKNPKLFTYLNDSKARVNVILGDARLSLVDAPNSSYDIIILDAFSSDSIPVHLLTKEAMDLYSAKLKPDGLLLVHTSNRYLDLDPVVAATGKAAGFSAEVAADLSRTNSTAQDSEAFANTTWVGLAKDPIRFNELKPFQFWVPWKGDPNDKVWTDDYSNVFAALRILEKKN